MMWNDSVVVRPAGAEHRVQHEVQRSEPPGVPHPRAERRLRWRGEGGVMTRALQDDAAHPEYVHVAAVVRSDPELLGVATRWAGEGIEAGDLVVVGGTPSFQQAVAEEFGDRDRISFDDRVRPNGRRGPDALAAVHALSQEAAWNGSGRLRVLAQVDQPDDDRVLREFACLESASNLMPVATPTSTLCIYDERRLPPDLVRTATATHPSLLGAGGMRPSDGFVHPTRYVRSLPLLREPLQDSVPLLAVDEATSLAELRHALGAELRSEKRRVGK